MDIVYHDTLFHWQCTIVHTSTIVSNVSYHCAGMFIPNDGWIKQPTFCEWQFQMHFVTFYSWFILHILYTAHNKMDRHFFPAFDGIVLTRPQPWCDPNMVQFTTTLLVFNMSMRCDYMLRQCVLLQAAASIFHQQGNDPSESHKAVNLMSRIFANKTQKKWVFRPATSTFNKPSEMDMLSVL